MQNDCIPVAGRAAVGRCRGGGIAGGLVNSAAFRLHAVPCTSVQGTTEDEQILTAVYPMSLFYFFSEASARCRGT